MIPNDRVYTQNDEWIMEKDGKFYIGITDYAQHELGDIVFVEMPAIDDEFNAGDDFGVVESVKAAAEVYSQVSGKVVEINEALDEDPALLNKDAYGTFIIAVEGTLDGETMDAEAYAAKIGA